MNPDDELVARVRRTAGERELEIKRTRSESDPTVPWTRNLPPATGTTITTVTRRARVVTAVRRLFGMAP